MNQAIFLSIATLLVIIMHLTFYRVLFYPLTENRKAKIVLLVFTVANFVSLLLYMAMFRHLDSVPRLIYYMMSLSIGIAFSLFFVALIFSILYLFVYAFSKLFKKINPLSVHKKTISISLVALAFVYVSYGVINGSRAPEIERVKVEIENLKRPLRAIFISDIHIGKIFNEERVSEIVKMSNRENPDVVFLGGVLVDFDPARIEKAIDALGELTAEHGVYFVLGNHEYMHGADFIVSKMQDIGIITLLNQSSTIPELVNIAGVTDLMAERMGGLFEKPDLDKATSFADPDLPTILLSHQPKIVEYLDNYKIDLVISGHTHGGQIFPFGGLVLLQQPYIKGLHRFKNSWLYISSGAGFWGPPMRTFSTSEITLLDIQ